jgi:hypothetical protein
VCKLGVEEGDLAKFLLEEENSRRGAIEQIMKSDSGNGVQRIAVSSYNSLGVVEKSHHPRQKMLLKVCGKDPSAWATHFHDALWVDRATVRKERRYSPFEAAHGYPPLLSIDALHLSFAWDAKPTTTGELTLAKLRIIEKPPEDKALLLERVTRLSWQSKDRFEKERTHVLFQGEVVPGMLVLGRDMVIRKDLDRKHKPRWLGSLVVMERKSQNHSIHTVSEQV